MKYIFAVLLSVTFLFGCKQERYTVNLSDYVPEPEVYKDGSVKINTAIHIKDGSGSVDTMYVDDSEMEIRVKNDTIIFIEYGENF